MTICAEWWFQFGAKRTESCAALCAIRTALSAVSASRCAIWCSDSPLYFFFTLGSSTTVERPSWCRLDPDFGPGRAAVAPGGAGE